MKYTLINSQINYWKIKYYIVQLIYKLINERVVYMARVTKAELEQQVKELKI